MSVDSDTNAYGCIRSDADETIVSTTFRLFVYLIEARVSVAVCVECLRGLCIVVH